MAYGINRIKVIRNVKNQRIEPTDEGDPEKSFFLTKKLDHIIWFKVT